ncbi:MAG: hypothetical protein OEY97_03465 [Nitrospirota bacterium]|nr:hypothetical protein [Nitrospirota bacterium]
MNNTTNPSRQPLAGLSVAISGASADAPLCILLHGYGAPGDDLVGLAGAFSPTGIRFLFPSAPLTLPPPMYGARAWWHIDWAARERQMIEQGELDLSDETPDGMVQAREQVSRLIGEACAAYGSTPDKVVLGGFSQGAMLACETALFAEVPPRALVLMSPTLLCHERWRQAAEARGNLPVFISHGRADPVLPFPQSERLKDMLGGAGSTVEWVPFSGAHEIPPAVLGPLTGFLARNAL